MYACVRPGGDCFNARFVMDNGMAESENPIPIWIAIKKGILSAYRSGTVVKLQAATAVIASGMVANSTALSENRSLKTPQILTESTNTSCWSTMKAVTPRIGKSRRSNMNTTKKGVAKLMEKFQSAMNPSTERKPASRRGSQIKARREPERSPSMGGSGKRMIAPTPMSPNKIPMKNNAEYASKGGLPVKFGQASTKNPTPRVNVRPMTVPQARRWEKTLPSESTGSTLRTSECHAGPGIAAMRRLKTRTTSKRCRESISKKNGRHTIGIHRSREINAHKTTNPRRRFHRSTA